MELDTNKRYECLDLHYDKSLLIRFLQINRYIDFKELKVTRWVAMNFVLGMYELLLIYNADVTRIFEVGNYFVEVSVYYRKEGIYLGLRVDTDVTQISKANQMIFDRIGNKSILGGLKNCVVSFMCNE